MNSGKGCVTAIACAVLFLTVHESKAADDSSPFEYDQSFTSLFEHGRSEITLTSGVLFSPFLATRNRPTINYTMTEQQFGWMLTDLIEAGWFRGNFEIAGEGFGSGIFTGRGNYIAGATAWLRYNFVPPQSRLAPYAQGGAGFVATDIDRGIVGQIFNFNLDLGFGFRYFIRPRWSLNLEYRYQHISNAGLGRKNLGINAHGPILGISYFL